MAISAEHLFKFNESIPFMVYKLSQKTPGLSSLGMNGGPVRSQIYWRSEGKSGMI